MVILTVIIVIISILLVAIILMQKSKGGGLAAGFQSNNQIMGAPKTADFLEKATWGMMIAIAVLCIASTILFSHGTATSTGSAIQEQQTAAPVMPENQDMPAGEAPAESN